MLTLAGAIFLSKFRVFVSLFPIFFLSSVLIDAIFRIAKLRFSDMPEADCA